MKVIFINQAEYLSPSILDKWKPVVPPLVRQAYLQKIYTKFYELGIPVMHASKLGIDLEALEHLNASASKLTKRYGRDFIPPFQTQKTVYIKALYQILEKAHGRKWLETEFNSNLNPQANTTYLIAQQAAQAIVQELEDEDKADILTNLTAENNVPEQADDEFFLQYFTQEQLKQLDLKVRKDEWILFLDETAILQPDFFTKLHNFLQLKVTPEVIDLAEPQLEQKLLAFVTADRSTPVTLDPKLKLKHQLLTAGPNYTSQVNDQNLLALQQWYEQQLFACLEPKSTIVDNAPDLKQVTKHKPKYKFVTDGSHTSFDLDLTNLTDIDFTSISSEELNLWDANYHAINEYKRGYHRYNEKMKSYFYIRVYEGSFGHSGFLIRASTLAKINHYKTHTLSNDLYLNEELKGLNVAYVRAPWVVGVACPNVLPQFHYKNKLIKHVDLWGRKLLCYFKQLSLTASLDTNFKVTK